MTSVARQCRSRDQPGIDAGLKQLTIPVDMTLADDLAGTTTANELVDCRPHQPECLPVTEGGQRILAHSVSDMMARVKVARACPADQLRCDAVALDRQ